MFGHGTSYDEEAFAETTVVEDEIQNQLTRSHCPTTAELSVCYFQASLITLKEIVFVGINFCNCPCSFINFMGNLFLFSS